MPVFLMAFAWTLVCWLPGCATPSNTGTVKEQVARGVDAVVQPFYPAYGTLAVKDLRPEYEPSTARAANTWDLTKLARATEKEYRFVPGDLLGMSCADLVEESRMETIPVHVTEDGTISLPLLTQRVQIGSLTAAEAEQVICKAYIDANLIRQPQLTIRILEHRTNTVYVIGAVKKPGAYELQSDDCDPLRAIVAAGGPTEDATSVVEVRRGGEQNEEVLRFDLTQTIAENAGRLQLRNGDIVSVEQKKLRPIYVAGSVNKPGEFPMPVDREIRVVEAVGLAGGVLNLSEPTTALVIRRPKGKAPVVIHVSLSRAARNPAENPRLLEGDVVTVVEDAASRTRKAIRTFLNLGMSLPVPIP